MFGLKSSIELFSVTVSNKYLLSKITVSKHLIYNILSMTRPIISISRFYSQVLQIVTNVHTLKRHILQKEVTSRKRWRCMWKSIKEIYVVKKTNEKWIILLRKKICIDKLSDIQSIMETNYLLGIRAAVLFLFIY